MRLERKRIRIESDGTATGTKVFGPSGATLTVKEMEIGKIAPRGIGTATITAYIARMHWTPFERKDAGGVHVDCSEVPFILRDPNGIEIPYVWSRIDKFDGQSDALVTFKVELHSDATPVEEDVQFSPFEEQRIRQIIEQTINEWAERQKRAGGVLHRG